MSRLSQVAEINALRTEISKLCVEMNKLTTMCGKLLDVLVQVPVDGGEDPTLWLPDELVEMIFMRLPVDMIWNKTCAQVCRRWRRIANEIQRRQRDKRWGMYEMEEISPSVIRKGDHRPIYALAVGLDGKIYSGYDDAVIEVWCNATLVQTLYGHTRSISSLKIGLDGKLYSGSYDKTIRVWSGLDGSFLQTLEGHLSEVECLAIGLDGNVYSGSTDGSVRIWSGVNGKHLCTLMKENRDMIFSVAVGMDGKVYTGSRGMIRIWSGLDGIFLQALVCPANDYVYCLLLETTGILYVGDSTGLMSVSSNEQWKTHAREYYYVLDLVLGSVGLFSASDDGNIRIWSEEVGPLYVLKGHTSSVHALAMAKDGKLYSGSDDGTIFRW